MDATSRRSGEASFDGADGVVWPRNPGPHHPGCRLMWLRSFLGIARPNPDGRCRTFQRVTIICTDVPAHEAAPTLPRMARILAGRVPIVFRTCLLFGIDADETVTPLSQNSG